jgi:hypothetical protein
VAVQNVLMSTPYTIAKQPGGKHHGWYLQQQKLTTEQLEAGITSFERQIAKHTGWIANPLTKTSDFYSFDLLRQQALVIGWSQDIQRHRDCIAILRGVILEKNT